MVEDLVCVRPDSRHQDMAVHIAFSLVLLASLMVCFLKSILCYDKDSKVIQ